MRDFAQRLADRKQKALYRRRIPVSDVDFPELVVDGRRCVSFCSNDYLGLASHPLIKQSYMQAVDLYGVGAGASQLVTGYHVEHQLLEQALAEFLQRPRVLLYSSGYLANLGTLSALALHGDRIYADRLNHASLVDAARLADAKVRRYRHAEADDLRRLIALDDARHKLIVSDGVFSMDGDLAPVAELVAIAAQQQALLMIDDAHGIGVLGEHGRGTLEQCDVATQVPVLVGTFGKAFGAMGAFVSGSEELIETLVQFSRTCTYSTAMPPASAAALRTALQVLIQETWRRQKLQALITRFRQGAAELGITLGRSSTPIQPVIIGEAAAAVEASARLRERGILITAIRPPTVPLHSARLRITLSAAHSEQQVDYLLECLAQVFAAGQG